MTKKETELFIQAAEALKESYSRYESFKLEVVPDEWHPGEGNLQVKIVYGDESTLFITCGYNFAYNMKRLFNNDAINSILR